MEKKEAMKILKDFHDKSALFSVRTALDTVLPELKELDDERIRKTIIELVRQSSEVLDKQNQNNMITWLEKQGQSKKISIWKHWKDGITGNGDGIPVFLIKNGSTYSLSSCLSFECDYIELSELDNLMLEKQCVIEISEPKFKAKDWITNGRYTKFIVGVNSDWPFYNFEDGTSERVKDIDKMYHLWTIQDAKDGDVLANKNGAIFINAGSSNGGGGTLDCYCYLSVQNEFCIEEHKTGSWLYKDDIKPATKEQKELILNKIKESGWSWNSETKELNRLKDK